MASGSEASVVIRLDPGDYILLCAIPDALGRLHAMKGMMSPLHVGKPISRGLPPETDMTAYLKEFYFSVTFPFRPGTHILRVVNEGTQAHELTVIRLDEGVNVQDFLATHRPRSLQGRAGLGVGGVTGLDPGQEAYVHLDLQPGRYGFVCFLADPVTLGPHSAWGMWVERYVQHLPGS